MDKVLIVPRSGDTPYVSLAQECSRRFEVWTLLNTLFPTVVDVVERPHPPYEITVTDKGGGSVITLYERLTLELEHFDATGEHWGADFWTVSNGSRCYTSYIPVVRWFRGVLSIHFLPPGPFPSDCREVCVTW